MSEDIGRRFMRETHHSRLGWSDQQRGHPEPPLEMRLKDDAETIALPKPTRCKPTERDFVTLVQQRTSVRDYAAAPLSLDQLAYLLWATQGVKEVQGACVTLRTVPSAGARHAFETVLLVNHVEGLAPGLHQYLAIEHRLAKLSTEPELDKGLALACFGQDMVRHSAVTFFWVAIPYRMTWRYGQRGYRYLHLDAGHVAQNLYLAAESLGAGACGIAAFDDDKLNDLLGLNGEDAYAIYVATVGLKGRA